MNRLEVIKDFCKPEEKMGTVIETLEVIVDILESRDNLDSKSYDDGILKAMFTLGFLPFYNVHGGVIRPLFLQAINQDKIHPADYFLVESLPTSLTIALPHQQIKYGEIREKVKKKLGVE